MEMNTTKLFLPVDGIFETFSSGHHLLRVAGGETIPAQLNGLCCKLSPSPNRNVQSRSQYPLNSSVKVSHIPKAGMEIIKTVRARWRPQDKKEVSRSLSPCHRHRHPSSEELRKVSGGSLPTKLEPEMREIPQALGLAKSRNCRRIVVLGAPKVGKTNILQRFLCQEINEHYEPTTEDFYRKLYLIQGETYQIDILDASRERVFPAKRRLSILTGDIFLLVFGVDDRESFKKVCELHNEIISAKTKLMKLKDSMRVPIVICGNKVDLDAHRVVSRSEMNQIRGKDAAFETSTKKGTGLDGMFKALVTLGGLPNETSPSKHQTVSNLAFQLLCAGKRDRRGSRDLALDAPCGAVYPLARRPSFNSDLQQVLRSSTKHNKPEKCHIQ